MSDRARGFFARERGGFPVGRAGAGLGRGSGTAGLANMERIGVTESDGDGKEDALELVEFCWERVAIFIDRLPVGVEVPVGGVNFASCADA